ncbi:MAG TPA: hypothetical protein VFR68_13940 [Candidatus Dormibacteraeota bacterium]|nr:hypothetical protein [Candidatus Dormibacteraeota bacterium]
MKPWLRNALTFGIGSAVVTLVLNLLGNATAGGDPCHRSSPLGQLGFLVFLILMGATGYMTTRAGDTVGMASVSGLVAALISAVGTVIAFAVIVGSLNPSCIPNNTTGVSSQTLLTTAGIAGGIILSVIGLGVGAGLAAIGGLIGRQDTTKTA